MRRCQALILYKDEASLTNFLKTTSAGETSANWQFNRHEWKFINDHIEILCIRGFKENMRGYRFDYIAVQEDLTWGEEWDTLKQYSLETMLTNQILPCPINIFDGIG